MSKPDIAFIIDDDAVFTYVLSKQLKLLNFTSTTLIFRNAVEALDHLKAIQHIPESLPTVIFLDLNMPVLDGWQFLDEFIKLNIEKNVSIYIVSSSIDHGDHTKALSYPQISGFYVKPISKENLAIILAELTGG